MQHKTQINRAQIHKWSLFHAKIPLVRSLRLEQQLHRSLRVLALSSFLLQPQCLILTTRKRRTHLSFKEHASKLHIYLYPIVQNLLKDRLTHKRSCKFQPVFCMARYQLKLRTSTGDKEGEKCYQETTTCLYHMQEGLQRNSKIYNKQFLTA